MKSYRNPEDNNSEEIRRSQNYVSVHEMLGLALSDLLPFKMRYKRDSSHGLHTVKWFRTYPGRFAAGVLESSTLWKHSRDLPSTVPDL